SARTAAFSPATSAAPPPRPRSATPSSPPCARDMPAPWSYEPEGRWVEHQLESALLRGNPLGDPHLRPLWVYLPPGYDAEPERRYASVYVIQGMTGQLDMWRNRNAFR